MKQKFRSSLFHHSSGKRKNCQNWEKSKKIEDSWNCDDKKKEKYVLEIEKTISYQFHHED